MKLNKQLFLLVFCSFLLQVNAQTSVFNPKTKWKSLESNSFQIITPSNRINIAKEILTKLNNFQLEDSLLGQFNDKRIYIIYGNHSVSNGFVGPGPYRSGLFLSPPQVNFIGPGSWIHNLVNHENHHFIQHANVRTGTLKLAYTLLGDYSDSFLSNTFLLNWFWEGNAVQRESRKNQYGRGNYSHFLNQNRIFASKKLRYNTKRFTYAYNKPFNMYIPNHYNLGYEMVNQLSKNYGANFLDKTIENSISKLKPFPKAIKHFSNKTLFTHFEEALDSINNQEQRITYIKPYLLLDKTTNFLNQKSPLLHSDGKLNYYISSSFLHTPELHENNKKVFSFGFSPDGDFRIQNNTNYIVWNELRPHPLYSGVSYSDIFIWDKQKSKKINLTQNRTNFSPCIHPKQDLIVFLDQNSDLEFILKTIDIKTKEEIILFNTHSEYIRNLNFSEDGKFVIYINQQKDNQIITIYDIELKAKQEFTFKELYQISEIWLSR